MVEALGKTLIISPHLDDAVFSYGELLVAKSGSVVVTVFAGEPAHLWPTHRMGCRRRFHQPTGGHGYPSRRGQSSARNVRRDTGVARFL